MTNVAPDRIGPGITAAGAASDAPRAGDGTSGFPHLAPNNFDLIRLFAATQVMVFHSLVHLSVETPLWLKPFGVFAGVPMFFVISGFLISASYERSRSLRDYAEKRARRIFPGLWLCLLVTFAVVALSGYDLARPAALAWMASQFVALVHTPAFLKDWGFGSYNGSLWTIPVELQFYAVLPLIASLWVAARSRPSRWALAIGLFVVATGVAVGVRLVHPSIIGFDVVHEPIAAKLLRYSFVSHIYLFALGFLIQKHFARLQGFLLGKALAWGVLLVVLDGTLDKTAPNVVAINCALAVFTISLGYTCIVRDVFRGNDISYGIYLYHGLVLNVLISLGLTGRLTHVALVAAASYALGFASWFGCEKWWLRRATIRSREVASRGEKPTSFPYSAC